MDTLLLVQLGVSHEPDTIPVTVVQLEHVPVLDVPVPDVVVPAPHAVQPVDPVDALAREPCAHAVQAAVPVPALK
ncbi:MAG: hypothetical protein FWG39_01160 [Alphaproteobacteria bacterium]|nr:hypothetical protein [Alphaproteobacteria bacterium]